MAQKIQTLFIDDIDGSDAQKTVRFALDGVEYEIDLSAGHVEEFTSMLDKYVRSARKVGRTAHRPAAKPSGSGINNTEIRAWARENGYDIKDRGRVPADIVAKYHDVTGK